MYKTFLLALFIWRGVSASLEKEMEESSNNLYFRYKELIEIKTKNGFKKSAERLVDLYDFLFLPWDVNTKPIFFEDFEKEREDKMNLTVEAGINLQKGIPKREIQKVLVEQKDEAKNIFMERLKKEIPFIFGDSASLPKSHHEIDDFVRSFMVKNYYVVEREFMLAQMFTDGVFDEKKPEVKWDANSNQLLGFVDEAIQKNSHSLDKELKKGEARPSQFQF